ncbi:MAG: (2Fe-2S) ferredoxin domain-containing protein [Proteobacteria bacterium]|nr:(2Fe-2S) ferredoxin domain-containing protein [Pseudomonadota bacterium]
MPQDETGFYDIHIFCCVNERPAGHPRGCCTDKGAVDLRDHLKKQGKARRADLAGRRVRVNQSGCLDRCELGPVMVIYPDNVWYHYETTADVDEILEHHVIGGEPVERLRLTRDQAMLDGTD